MQELKIRITKAKIDRFSVDLKDNEKLPVVTASIAMMGIRQGQ